MYVSDTLNFRIRKISPSGTITTIAGTGEQGFSGDGGAATAAKIFPVSVTVDNGGRVFFSDASVRIRQINTDGVVSTIAGTGTPYAFDESVEKALDASLTAPFSLMTGNDGSVYFVELPIAKARRIYESGGHWNIETLFTGESKPECGSGRISGKVGSEGLDQAIENSLAIVCQGTPYVMGVHDSCPAEGGLTKVAISQGFFEYANIIEIQRPCSN